MTDSTDAGLEPVLAAAEAYRDAYRKHVELCQRAEEAENEAMSLIAERQASERNIQGLRDKATAELFRWSAPEEEAADE